MEEEESLQDVLKTSHVKILLNGNSKIDLHESVVNGIRNVVRDRIEQIVSYRENLGEE